MPGDSAKADTSNKTDPIKTLLASLWEKTIPVVEDRLSTLEAAAAAARAGTLDEETRQLAAENAHKLAGSLGMFGYPEGTRCARDIELLLDAASAPDAARFTSLVGELRAALAR